MTATTPTPKPSPLPSRFAGFQVYSSRPELAYVLYHLPRSLAEEGSPRFLRLYPTGDWTLHQTKGLDCPVTESSHFPGETF